MGIKHNKEIAQTVDKVCGLYHNGQFKKMTEVIDEEMCFDMRAALCDPAFIFGWLNSEEVINLWRKYWLIKAELNFPLEN